MHQYLDDNQTELLADLKYHCSHFENAQAILVSDNADRVEMRRVLSPIIAMINQICADLRAGFEGPIRQFLSLDKAFSTILSEGSDTDNSVVTMPNRKATEARLGLIVDRIIESFEPGIEFSPAAVQSLLKQEAPDVDIQRSYVSNKLKKVAEKRPDLILEIDRALYRRVSSKLRKARFS